MSESTYDKSREWYLRFYKTTLPMTKGLDPEAMGHYLIRKFEETGHKLDIKDVGRSYKDNCTQILAVGKEFPIAILKSMFEWMIGREYCEIDRRKAYFIVWNDYAAFTNNPQIKYYIPSLGECYQTIEDALSNIFEDCSRLLILKTQSINLSNPPESVESSEIWHPYEDSSRKHIRGFEILFKELISTRKEVQSKYSNNYLNIVLNGLSNMPEDKKVIISDIYGNIHLIKLQKIIHIIVDNNDDENLHVEIQLENKTRITTDLKELTKVCADFSLDQPLNLPVSLVSNETKSFPITQPRVDNFYQNIWSEYKQILDSWYNNNLENIDNNETGIPYWAKKRRELEDDEYYFSAWDE